MMSFCTITVIMVEGLGYWHSCSFLFEIPYPYMVKMYSISVPYYALRVIIVLYVCTVICSTVVCIVIVLYVCTVIHSTVVCIIIVLYVQLYIVLLYVK